MMKSFRSLYVCAFALVAAACTTTEVYNVYPEFGDDYYADNAYLSSDSPYFTIADDGGTVNFKSKGGEAVIKVNCETEWTAVAGGDDWFETAVSREFGTLTLTAGQNLSDERKTGAVTISVSGLVFATITVTQNAFGTPEIKAATNSWRAPATGVLSTEIAVESSYDEWSALTSCLWLFVEKTDSGIILTVDENVDTEERSTEVVLTSVVGGESGSDTITVTQDGKVFLSVSAGSFFFFDDGEARISSARVESNFDWDFSYDSSNGWFSVERDGDTISAAVSGTNESEDRREGTILITAGDGMDNVEEYVIHVAQLGLQRESLILIYTLADAGTEVQLPLGGTVDCTIDWGDGSVEEVAVAAPSHIFDSPGDYVVCVKGTVTALSSQNIDKEKCRLLTGIRQWGATGLTDMSYAFCYCSNLDSLPGDTLGAFSEVTTFQYAFYYCGTASYISGSTIWDPETAAGLATVSPDLLQYATKCESFYYTFYSCYNLREIPEGLLRNCRSATSFQYCFTFDINVPEVPNGLFDACTELVNAANIFTRCSSVVSVPGDLFANCPKINDLSSCFAYDYLLAEIPDNIFSPLTKCANFFNVFGYCTALVRIPAGLFSANAECTTFERAFDSCSGLKEIPSGLFDGNMKVTNFRSAFNGCSSLTGESPYTEIEVNGSPVKVHLYDRENYTAELGCVAPATTTKCFYGCTGLSDYADMSSAWK